MTDSRWVCITVVLVAAIVSSTLLGGCWMTTIAPIERGQCAKWVKDPVAPPASSGYWLVVPCPTAERIAID